MSTEPDYNFNEPAAPAAGGNGSILLPVALVTATIAVFMFAQTTNAIFTRTNLREGKEQLILGKAQLADLSRSREPAVKQAMEVQKKLQDLVVDLMLLAKTDKEAENIVKKFNISQATPPSGDATAPAPAPAN